LCTDSRSVQPGDIFFALKGENYDGHAFLGEAVRRGAVAVVAARGPVRAPVEGVALILVEETLAALGDFAAWYRRGFDFPVVAVGGSNGKTTTKELTAAVLRQSLPTLWSDASFNNAIGVPTTLLRIESSHRVAVIEVGTNHPGELAPLVAMAAPKYGVLTNVGREHLEFFGDEAGVAREEGWLAELLPADGRLFANGDNVWTDEIARRCPAPVVRVGLGDRNDWRAEAVVFEPDGVRFRVAAPGAGFSREYRVGLLGRHQVVNSLLAIAVGAELGLSPGRVARGLAECKGAKMRMQLLECNGVRILDDSYNANSDSMAAALATLQELPCDGRRIAVLGDMAELGAQSEAAHEELGRRAAELGVGQLFAVGRNAAFVARGARRGGLHRVFEFADVEAAAQEVKRFLKHGDLMLVKASRSTRLERVTEAVRAADFSRGN